MLGLSLIPQFKSKSPSLGRNNGPDPLCCGQRPVGLASGRGSGSVYVCSVHPRPGQGCSGSVREPDVVGLCSSLSPVCSPF